MWRRRRWRGLGLHSTLPIQEPSWYCRTVASSSPAVNGPRPAPLALPPPARGFLHLGGLSSAVTVAVTVILPPVRDSSYTPQRSVLPCTRKPGLYEITCPCDTSHLHACDSRRDTTALRLVIPIHHGQSRSPPARSKRPPSQPTTVCRIVASPRAFGLLFTFRQPLTALTCEALCFDIITCADSCNQPPPRVPRDTNRGAEASRGSRRGSARLWTGPASSSQLQAPNHIKCVASSYTDCQGGDIVSGIKFGRSKRGQSRSDGPEPGAIYPRSCTAFPLSLDYASGGNTAVRHQPHGHPQDTTGRIPHLMSSRSGWQDVL